MKHSVPVLAALLSACLSTAAADKLAVELGNGVHNNHGSEAVFLRYARDFGNNVLPIGKNFYEWSLASWNGEARNNAVGFAFGTLGRRDAWYADASIGIAYLEDKTVLSGTHQQFSARLGVGVVHDRIGAGLYLTHYSNAKPVFGWDGPNAGYDFVTLQLSYVLP